MLRYALGEEKAANRIDDAIRKSLKQGYRTSDIGDFDAVEIVSCSEMGDIVARYASK